MNELFFKNPIDSIKIENTNICNANCIFCSYGQMTRRKESMPFELFAQSVDQIAEMGIPNISFSPINGEPLVDPGFFEKLAYLTRYSFQVTSISNAILLHRCDAKKIVALLLSLKQLRISMAPNSPAYREMYRVDQFNHVLDGLKLLQQYKGEGACDVVVNIRWHTEKPMLDPELRAILEDDFFTVSKQDYSYKNWGAPLISFQTISRLTIPTGRKKHEGRVFSPPDQPFFPAEKSVAAHARTMMEK